MGRKANKSTRKFAASGELKRTITARRKHKAVKKKAQVRGAEKERRKRVRETAEGASDDEEEEEPQKAKVKGK
jgi:nucleolar complex protein 2